MPMPKPSVITFPISIPATYRLPPRIPFKDQNYYNDIKPLSANPTIDHVKLPVKIETQNALETNKKEPKPAPITTQIPVEEKEKFISTKCDRYTQILKEFEQRKKLDMQDVSLIKKLQQELLFTTENAKVIIQTQCANKCRRFNNKLMS
jgi:hypothetical protein